MTRTKLKAAISEAERFLTKARIALAQNDAPPSADSMYQGKHNAAAVRASLDLTRILAEMRK
jgi:hypothetical protein